MPCRRCRSRGEECAYEDKKWRTKDHLRSEIERLRAEQRQGHALIRSLTNNDPKQWEAVLARLRSDESPDDIAEWICSMKALPCTPRKSSQGLADANQLDDTPTYTLPKLGVRNLTGCDASEDRDPGIRKGEGVYVGVSSS